MNAATQTFEMSPTVAAVLARAGLLDAANAGPLILARGPGWRIVWANPAAAEFLGSDDLSALTRTLIAGNEPGARQLARQADRMTPGPDVADLRLRLRIRGQLQMITLSCRRLEGEAPVFAISPWGYRAAATSSPPLAPAVDESQKTTVATIADNALRPHVTDRRGNVRFLWRTNRTGELASITGALCESVGCDPELLIGRDFRQSIAELKIDPANRLRDALSHEETWSGIEVLWPIANTTKAVPVVLGGLPCFDRARAFDGFSGFGVIHLDRVADAPVVEASPQPLPQAIEHIQTPLGDVTTSAVAPESLSTLADEIRAESAEREEAELQSAAADEAELRALPSHGTLAGISSDAGQDNTETSIAFLQGADSEAADKATSEEETTTSVAIVEEATSQSQSSETAAGESATTTIVPEAANGNHRNNVVPLRAWQKEPPKDQRAPLAVTETPTFARSEEAGGKTASEKVAQQPVGKKEIDGPEKLVGLSQAERNAFREIARALGARNAEKKDASGQEAIVTPKVEEPTAVSPTSNAIDASANSDKSVVAEGSAAERVTSTALPDAGDVAPQLPDAHAESARADTPATASTTPEAEIETVAPQFIAQEPQTTSGNEDVLRLMDRVDSGLLVARGGVPAYANKTLLDLLGYASIDDLHSSGGIERMFRGRDPGALSRDADGGAIPVIAANGEVLALEVRVQAAEWESEPATLMTFRRTQGPELSARIRALELDLRAREAEARETHAILDTATDGVVLIDEDGRILTLNKSAQALFGYDQNEVVGEPVTVLFARESHAPAMDYLAGLKTNGVKSLLNDGREIAGRASRGGAIPLFMTLGRVGAATPQRFCAVLRDLTQWKKVERELGEAKRDAERASQLKSDFLAKVSHEIRTPLNAILGFAEVIMDERFGPVGNDRYKDYLKDIHSSGTHVLSLVNDLLDLSKIEAGKLDLNFGAVDANRIVNECVSLIQTQATRERVIIRLSLAPRLPNIVADERSLRQIALNILSNAVKFNEPGGQVIVSTALTDAGHAVIRIRDTGIGMSEKELETALEPFRQIATSRQTTGTGLGLPLTKALVEANRASFTIKSRKGEGTLVEVSFPQTRVLAE